MSGHIGSLRGVLAARSRGPPQRNLQNTAEAHPCTCCPLSSTSCCTVKARVKQTPLSTQLHWCPDTLLPFLFLLSVRRRAPGAARRAAGCCARAGASAPAPRTAGCSARPTGRRRRPPGTRPPPAARACAPPGLPRARAGLRPRAARVSGFHCLFCLHIVRRLPWRAPAVGGPQQGAARSGCHTLLPAAS